MPDKFLNFETKLLIEQDSWVASRHMQGQIFAHVGLNDVIEDKGPNATIAPVRVNAKVSKVGFIPACVRYKNCKPNTKSLVKHNTGKLWIL